MRVEGVRVDSERWDVRIGDSGECACEVCEVCRVKLGEGEAKYLSDRK